MCDYDSWCVFSFCMWHPSVALWRASKGANKVHAWSADSCNVHRARGSDIKTLRILLHVWIWMVKDGPAVGRTSEIIQVWFVALFGNKFSGVFPLWGTGVKSRVIVLTRRGVKPLRACFRLQGSGKCLSRKPVIYRYVFVSRPTWNTKIKDLNKQTCTFIGLFSFDVKITFKKN